eukprot:gene17661-17867_t
MALIKRRAKAEDPTAGAPAGAGEDSPPHAAAQTPMDAPMDAQAAYADHARMIRQSGMRLLDVVNRLVELSRLDAGAADLHLRPTRAQDVVEDALRAVSNLAKERSVTLAGEVPDALPRVRGDARALVTVLHNLLSNAVEASPSGGVARLIVDSDGRQVSFIVLDEGDGVSADLLPRIIHPFVQGENALVRQTTGAAIPAKAWWRP